MHALGQRIWGVLSAVAATGGNKLENKEISQAVIARLPRYFRFLGELKDEGIERISSQELSDIMKVTASQDRKSVV